MRKYLKPANLATAAVIGLIVSIMAIPRMLNGELPLSIYFPAAFLAMTLFSGAVTAWGGCAGMNGLMTDRTKLVPGLLIVLLFSLLVIPIQVNVLTPLIHARFASAAGKSFMALRYPPTLDGKIALLLWSAGFESIFFYAAPMSYFSRLSGNRWIALILTAIFRIFVVFKGLNNEGLGLSATMITTTVAASATGCMIYGFSGLVPVMAFAACITLHIFF